MPKTPVKKVETVSKSSVKPDKKTLSEDKKSSKKVEAEVQTQEADASKVLKSDELGSG